MNKRTIALLVALIGLCIAPLSAEDAKPATTAAPIAPPAPTAEKVDKKGKDWNNAENPSNGKIMWLAWGGDAGYSWSRKIVEREKNMKKDWHGHEEEIIEEIKDMLDDVVNPITKAIEIEIEEDDIKILIPDNIRHIPTTVYSFNVENLAKATNVGFKGGRLKLR